MEEKIKIFKDKCCEYGLKITPQRELIYRCLAESFDHPSTETVHKRVREKFPNISLDTVNRTLITFNEIGLAFVVEGSGDVRRYDAGSASHQHFKCVKCKRIVDFKHEPFNNISTPPQIDSRFKVLRKTVYFEGLCDKCNK